VQYCVGDNVLPNNSIVGGYRSCFSMYRNLSSILFPSKRNLGTDDRFHHFPIMFSIQTRFGLVVLLCREQPNANNPGHHLWDYCLLSNKLVAMLDLDNKTLLLLTNLEQSVVHKKCEGSGFQYHGQVSSNIARSRSCNSIPFVPSPITTFFNEWR
jgi:hypothetical protein